MDTTTPLPLIPYVDLAGDSAFQKGLTRDQLGYLGCVYFTVSDAELDKVFGFLQRHVSIHTYVNVTKVTSKDEIISILDAGACTVFVQASQLESLKTYGDRIAVIKDESTPDAPGAGGVLVEGGNDISACKSALETLAVSKATPIFLFANSKNTTEEYVSLAREQKVVLIVAADQLTIENTGSNGFISVPSIIASSWTSDRNDKLVPTLVTDERGISLGLVYSSKESLSESFKTGTGVYQSRKRGLWYKGATSGDTQELVRVALDCDQDCLKFIVKQNGRGETQVFLIA
jgi:phosphoribosyl-ATP pyrophosphohydrolase/phosphoribosyl-AMP cyclohydrolase/histidinol dehydrogenase